MSNPLSHSRWLDRLGSPNLTDLYQLTMLQAYRHIGMDDTAVFEFFVRKLPDHRNFLLAAGLEQLLDYLVDLRFEERDLEALRRTEKLDDAFIDSLAEMRFTGDVDAMPEGTAFFGNEPIARVVAPLPEAQLIETRVVNLLQMQTLIASKAARMRLAAHDHQRLVDFGLRRAHGSEAGLFAARAAWIGGFDGTATVLANELYGIPLFGTMAHSFIQAHDSEMQAFEDFCRSQPENTVLLIDTYDTEEGARKVVELARKLEPEGFTIRGVRIDSGDLCASAKAVRRILDEGGCEDIEIMVSGGLNEDRIAGLAAAGIPATGYGVGTDLDVSADAPYLDCVYKIQEYAGIPRRKKSAGKATWPGRKQVFRHYRDDGSFDHDVIGLVDEALDGEPLLGPVMRAGERLGEPEPLTDIRERAAAQMAALPRDLSLLPVAADPYRVEISDGMRDMAERVDKRVERKE
ncbi:nicotinate phosphoribosyltransferase [Lentisalinibacter salinarum]|uniref:nicotinate phosphoribosyltransferase n=1 Tax=Lentisalinibacter salinarum TaxID=2992239 RepID=UPI00386B0924